jgi:hypothetical protein
MPHSTRIEALDEKARAERVQRAPTAREAAVIACQGMPAAAVAVRLRCPVHEVLEIRNRLRARGAIPDFPHRRAPHDPQMQLDV